VEPVEFGGVAHVSDNVSAGARDRVERVFRDLAMREHRRRLIQQVHERADNARLRLPTFAKKYDVLSGEDGVDDVRDNRLFVTENAGKELLTCPNLRYQVFAHLFP